MDKDQLTKRYIVGITGASGSIYGVRLAARLLALPVEVHVIVSAMGRKVMAHELGGQRASGLVEKTGLERHPESSLKEYEDDRMFAGPASGSFGHQGMVIAPCSMKTLAAVANGISQNLLLRAADVTLKERRPLVLMPREAPLSRVHLSNMLAAHDAGALVMPPMPGFYHHPESIEDIVDFSVARAMEQLGLAQDIIEEWGK